LKVSAVARRPACRDFELPLGLDLGARSCEQRLADSVAIFKLVLGKTRAPLARRYRSVNWYTLETGGQCYSSQDADDPPSTVGEVS
jgi:hypothetical protein